MTTPQEPFAPLVRRLETEALVLNDRILKIDHFLNHRIEPEFMAALGAALAKRLVPYAPELVLTAEASGIAPGLATATALGVPLVFAKKYSADVEAPAISRIVPSATRGIDYRLVVSERFLPVGARVALVDDFLANGRTAMALAEIVVEAGAHCVAAGFIVEKLFQHGRDGLLAQGIPVIALAQVARLEAGRVVMAGQADHE
jgi:xanthine phosphoribosyltransferase